ncbi:MAG: hypothetical protein LW742_04835 [Sphingomonadales bacterium]|nr:hypothetical protein [Sphingomonadales bacterium]
MNMHDLSDDRSFDAALRREMEYLLASSMFRKSPKLSQLLAYLVGATLRGEGETLKSYTVAVDGLGRAADFDAQADSYPRVQVMRLRNFLSSFYARYEPVGELCIYILPGSYRVRLAKFAIAYPDIVVRNARRRLGSSAVEVDPVAVAKAAPSVVAGRNRFKLPQAVLWGGAAAAALVAAVLFVPKFGKGDGVLQGVHAPVLRISDISTGADPLSREIAGEIEHALENGIAQSWAVDTLGSVEGNDSGSARADYRLDANLTRLGGDGRQLLMEMIDKSDGRIIWSESYPIDDSKPIQPQLHQALVQITTPLGVIGRRELASGNTQKYSGYRCLVAAQAVIAGKTFVSTENVKQCLDQPLGNPQLEAVRLSSAAMRSIQEGYFNSQTLAIANGEDLAERAIETYPDEASGHFALAWMNYIQNSCAAGNYHAEEALRHNPYDRTATVYLASFAEECAFPGGPELVERALASRVDGQSSLGLAIVNLALKSGRSDILGSVSPRRSTSVSADSESLLCDATALRRQSWAAFVKLQRRPGATPDELLQKAVFSKANRARILNLLREKAVLSAA